MMDAGKVFRRGRIERICERYRRKNRFFFVKPYFCFILFLSTFYLIVLLDIYFNSKSPYLQGHFLTIHVAFSVIGIFLVVVPNLVIRSKLRKCGYGGILDAWELKILAELIYFKFGLKALRVTVPHVSKVILTPSSPLISLGWFLRMLNRSDQKLQKKV